MAHPSTTSASAGSRAARGVLGLLIALIGQAVVFGAAFLAGQVADVGWGDMHTLGAIAGTFLVGEVVLLIACVVVSLVLMARGRRDFGAGLLGGGLLAVLAFAVWVIVTTR